MSTPLSFTGARRASRQRGFSLVELMVAMVLSLILLAGVLAIFASSRTTYETTDRLSRIQESGKFALDTIVRDLRSAGFIGCSRRADFTNALKTPTSLMLNFQFGVQGFDAQGSSWLPALDTSTSGASGAAPGSDVLVVRVPVGEFEPVRLTDFMSDTTANITVEHTAPAKLKPGDVVQISDCNARAVFQITAYTAGDVAHADSGGSPGNSTADIGYAFSDLAEIVPVRSVLYYLGTPTGGAVTSLYRRNGNGAGAEELVEGVENMQIEYGVETAANTIDYRTADAVGSNWDAVRTVRIALLVRSMSAYGTDAGAKSYLMLGQTIEDPRDRHMRQVFTTTVSIRNASS